MYISFSSCLFLYFVLIKGIWVVYHYQQRNLEQTSLINENALKLENFKLKSESSGKMCDLPWKGWENQGEQADQQWDPRMWFGRVGAAGRIARILCDRVRWLWNLPWRLRSSGGATSTIYPEIRVRKPQMAKSGFRFPPCGASARWLGCSCVQFLPYNAWKNLLAYFIIFGQPMNLNMKVSNRLVFELHWHLV